MYEIEHKFKQKKNLLLLYKIIIQVAFKFGLLIFNGHSSAINAAICNKSVT